MEALTEMLKVIFFGILEGVTEWLPISSTGHLLLVDRWLCLEESDAFKEVFFVVIQLGAVLAVFFHFGKKMLPFSRQSSHLSLKIHTASLWLKVVLACVPGAVVTLLFDNALEDLLTKTKLGGKIPLMSAVISLALILYGILFLLIEGKRKLPHTVAVEQIRWKDAFHIGLFQALSIIPGTSRSGSTILGAMTLGIGRSAASEFSFFLAVPVMAGYSLLKLLKFGFAFSPREARLLLIGSLCAFLTSLAVIRFLMSYVKRHSFALFGIYRILLGLAVPLSFLL